MASGKHVAYYRVSTAKQGRSGLGLEAQQEAVNRYLNGGSWEMIAEFTEIETGKRADRPKLGEALAYARMRGATLVVAKLDRLARDAKFLLTLIDSGVDVVFCDLPQLPAGPVGRFMLTQMSAVAELEAGLISQRTKAALAAAKARGVRLGGRRGTPIPHPLGNAASAKIRKEKSLSHALNVMSEIDRARAVGAQSLRQIAAVLNDRGINTPRPGGQWQAAQVKAVLDRVGRANAHGQAPERA